MAIGGEGARAGAGASGRAGAGAVVALRVAVRMVFTRSDSKSTMVRLTVLSDVPSADTMNVMVFSDKVT
jgi:hypothetical protein